MNKNEHISVIYFFRKPQKQYHSIERVFHRIIDNLPSEIIPKVYKLQNGDRGLISRVKALVEVYQNRGSINHITGDISYVALALPRKGLIVTFHDLESLARSNRFISKVLKFLWVIIPARRAEYITVISEHTKEQVIKWSGISSNKIHVIHNPIPDGFVYTPKDFNKEKPNVLCAGTKDNKNLEGTIEAVKELACQLTILGYLSEKQIELLKKYQIEYTNLYGITDERMIEVYQQCDILCFPSFFEGFGMPIIEAQAIGRPVITSNYGAMKEVAGKGAVFIDPNNPEDIKKSIDRLITEDKLREELIHRGIENAATYSADSTAELYTKVYKMVSR